MIQTLYIMLPLFQNKSVLSTLASVQTTQFYLTNIMIALISLATDEEQSLDYNWGPLIIQIYLKWLCSCIKFTGRYKDLNFFIW